MTSGADGRSHASTADVSLLGALRLALRDVSGNWWPLVAANLAWTVVAILLVAVASVVPYGFLLLPLLALPTAGIFRVATRIAREDPVGLGDAIDAWRTDLPTTIALGIGAVGALAVLSANIAIGLASSSLFGWTITTLAAWSLLLLWLLAWTVWPIVVDQARAGSRLRDRLRLAGFVLLARPVGVAVLGIVLAILLLVSTVAIVPLAVVSVALAALLASRYVIPIADQLETRLLSGGPGEG